VFGIGTEEVIRVARTTHPNHRGFSTIDMAPSKELIRTPWVPRFTCDCPGLHNRVSAFEIVLAGDPTCRGDRRSPGAGAKPAGQEKKGRASLCDDSNSVVRAGDRRSPLQRAPRLSRCPFAPELTDITHRTSTRFALEEERCSISEMRPIRKCDCPGLHKRSS